jgi:subtilase family serine protease
MPARGFVGTNPYAGYTPVQLRDAYGLASAAATAGRGHTVAIVDAYDDPNAVSDLSNYRSTFGLSGCAGRALTSGCTLGNGATVRKVAQNGGQRYPHADVGWAQEISLDLDMVSAICPACSILLVEAASNQFSDLGAAVDEAAALGATEISNSYGGGEWSGELGMDAHFRHPGLAVTASTGDNGYEVQFPAASPYVIAVGGTSLRTAHSARGWTETAWSGAGSGCSAFEPQPAWQAAIAGLAAACARRAGADVSAVADPATGVSVYDSYAKGSAPRGWLVFGGTSVASPIIASTYALAGNAATVTAPSAGAGGYAAGLYAAAPSSLNDVVSGSNGSCGSLLCTARAGWDGPTGLGTPSGTGAF